MSIFINSKQIDLSENAFCLFLHTITRKQGIARMKNKQYNLNEAFELNSERKKKNDQKRHEIYIYPAGSSYRFR